MEPKSTFVWPNRTIKLNAEPTVYLDISFIVDPRNTEDNRPFRLDNPFKNIVFHVFGMLVDDRSQRMKYFSNGLDKFFLIAIFGMDFGQYVLDVFFGFCGYFAIGFFCMGKTIKLVNKESTPQFWFKPRGFGRHNQAGIGNVHNFFHRYWEHGEANAIVFHRFFLQTF